MQGIKTKSGSQGRNGGLLVMQPQERSSAGRTRGRLLSSRSLASHRNGWMLANRQSVWVTRVPGHREGSGRDLEGYTVLTKV